MLFLTKYRSYKAILSRMKQKEEILHFKNEIVFHFSFDVYTWVVFSDLGRGIVPPWSKVQSQVSLAFSRQHLLSPQNLSGGSKEQMAFAGLFNNMICMLEMRSPK